MLKVLEITTSLDGGGVDKLLYEYCRRMRNNIQFDFIVVSESDGILEKDLIDIGCNIYHVKRLLGSTRQHIKEIEQIYSKERYDIVHDHSGYKAFINLYLAKKHRITVRIAHSHLAFIPENAKSRYIRKLCTILTKHYATDLFACGEDAARWTWGQDKAYIMTNAIDSEAYEFSETKRQELRNRYGIEDKIVLGNVARFSEQKNHEYLLRIFEAYHKHNVKSVLVLIGQGELYESTVDLIKELRLERDVLLLGVRDDVYDLMNMMDVFLLPSLYEGLPVTMIEAQANGLPIIASSNITKEVKINENITYVPIDDGSVREWISEIERLKNKRTKNAIKNTEYDIRVAANIMDEKYHQFLHY